jgi:hypothetical protein
MEFSSMFSMNRLIFVALSMFILSLSACAQPPENILSIQRLPAKDKQTAIKMTEKLRPLVMKYAETNSLVAKDYPYETHRNSIHYRVSFDTYFEDFDLTNTKFQNAETLYDLIFDGRPYVAGVGSFVPMLTAVPSCIPSESGTSASRCGRMAENNQVCHLFLFDFQTHAITAAGAMPIERDNRPMPGGKERGWWNYNPKYPNDPRQIEGWPRCDGVLAVAPAKVVPNALLITLTYIDSGAPITKHENEYPPKFITTSLLRFSTDAQGRVQMKQDQRCLGNPNTITSIAAARKVLAACEAASAHRDERR